MLLPEILLDAFPEDSASGLKIYCSNSEKQKEIALFFETTFAENWEKQKEVFEEEIGMEPDEIDVPIISDVLFSEEGVTFLLLPLDMQANDGARGYNEFGTQAFDDSIKALEEKYPNIQYEGCIQYAWFDEHTGETVAYEVPRRSDKAYDFVGKMLNQAIEGGEIFDDFEWSWDGDEETKKELLKTAEDYREYLSDTNYQRFVTFVEELDTE